MATTSGDSINILTINTKDSQLLTDLYEYDFLEIAIQENIVWVKNIPEGLIKTAIIQRIPSQSMYSTKEGLLYPYGKQIPVGDLPELNWQAIQEKLTVMLPSINPNYFGVQASVAVQLVPSMVAQKGVFLLVNLANLEAYLKTVGTDIFYLHKLNILIGIGICFLIAAKVKEGSRSYTSLVWLAPISYFVYLAHSNVLQVFKKLLFLGIKPSSDPMFIFIYFDL